MSSNRDADGASEYLLTMILQRLEVMQPGLIHELQRGVEGDREAVARSDQNTDMINSTFERAQAILQRAASGK